MSRERKCTLATLQSIVLSTRAPAHTAAECQCNTSRFSSRWVVNLLWLESDFTISLCQSCFLSWQTHRKETGTLLSFPNCYKNIFRVVVKKIQHITHPVIWKPHTVSAALVINSYIERERPFQCLISFTAVLRTKKSSYIFNFHVEIRVFLCVWAELTCQSD